MAELLPERIVLGALGVVFRFQPFLCGGETLGVQGGGEQREGGGRCEEWSEEEKRGEESAVLHYGAD